MNYKNHDTHDTATALFADAVSALTARHEIKTATDVVIEAASQSLMLERLAEALVWKSTNPDVLTANDLVEALVAELVELFDSNSHMPSAIVETMVTAAASGAEGFEVGQYSEEEIAPFIGK